MIFAGAVSLLSLVSLRHDLGAAAGANSAALVTTAASHVAIYNWTFLLSQSLIPGINALLLGTLLYRSRLVPRIIPVIGFIGAPLHHRDDRSRPRRTSRRCPAAYAGRHSQSANSDPWADSGW